MRQLCTVLCRCRAEPLPEPVLERVQTDEHRIRWCEEVPVFPEAPLLPAAFSCVDENQSSLCPSATCLEDDLVAGQSHDVGERRGMQSHRGRRVEGGRCSGDVRVIEAGMPA